VYSLPEGVQISETCLIMIRHLI